MNVEGRDPTTPFESMINNSEAQARRRNRMNQQGYGKRLARGPGQVANAFRAVSEVAYTGALSTNAAAVFDSFDAVRDQSDAIRVQADAIRGFYEEDDSLDAANAYEDDDCCYFDGDDEDYDFNDAEEGGIFESIVAFFFEG